MNEQRSEFTFLWLIENYSYCWHKNGEKLISPEFTPQGFENTTWNIQMYPRGKENKFDQISLLLYRIDCFSPEQFPLEYELSALAADGSVLFARQHEMIFKKGVGCGTSKILKRDEVILQQKTDYLPHDTLTVCCKMWRDEVDNPKVGKCIARTCISVEKISFLFKVKNFTNLAPNEKKTLHVPYLSELGCTISSILYFTLREGQVFVEIVPSESYYILAIQKLSLIDGQGNVVECANVDNRFDSKREDIKKVPLSISRNIILNRKSEYLVMDELTVICECTFSAGVEFERIEETQHEIPRAVIKLNCNKESKNNGYNYQDKLFACPSALEDLKTIYNNQQLTDVKLITKTKSFSAHKLVLCARSSVFNAMLTNDMREKNTDCIEIEDLEDNTVQEFLLFLYTDKLENLHWESAVKLYYAADKYAVEKLKVFCSSFLVDNQSTSNVSELLLLADIHNDLDLKKCVEDFILQHEEEVFSSDEWEKLSETNPLLVLKAMQLKYKRKKESK